MAHNINWYAGMVKELENDFRDRNLLFDEIDKMVRPEWALPSSFTETVKNVMAVIDTTPSDAIHSGAIAFSSVTPNFNVTPFMANVAEYDRVQKIEDNIVWNFKKANKRGNGTTMYDMADSSLRYNTVCVRVDDLAKILPGDRNKWTPLQRRAWAGGRFIHKAYHPRGVYYAEAPLGMTAVAHVEAFRIADFIKNWELYANNDTKEGTMVQAALEKLKDRIGYNVKSSETFRQTFFMQVYCLDDDRLMIWGNVVGDAQSMSSTIGDSQLAPAEYVFADQENKDGYINWSIRVAGSRLESEMKYRVNPLLAPLYWSKSWDKLNLARSIIFSEPIRRAQMPRWATFTDDGEPVEVDEENGGNIAMRRGEDIKGLQPITLDQGAMAIVQQLSTEMNRTTGASMIGDTTQISSRTPFATFSAMVKVALQRLDRQREVLARSAEDIACLYLWSAKKTKKSLVAYASENKQYRSGTMVPMGQMLEVRPEDYSLDDLGIAAKIVTSSPIDQMEQLNRAIQLSTHMNVPSSMLLEEMGYENVGPMYDLWAREFLQKSELQAMAAKMLAQAQMEVQMEAQAGMQQGAQAGPAPAGAGGGISQTAFGSLGGLGNGINPAMGGGIPAQSAPTMTRENITQRNFAQEQ